jgi:hypothetical protein
MVILKYIPLGVNLLISLYLLLYGILDYFESKGTNGYRFDLSVFRIFHAEYGRYISLVYFLFILNAVILLPFLKSQNNLKIFTVATSVIGWILLQSVFQYLFPW